MFRFIGQAVAGTTKFVVRNVVVPVAITVVLAAALKAVAERLEEPKPTTRPVPPTKTAAPTRTPAPRARPANAGKRPAGEQSK